MSFDRAKPTAAVPASGTAQPYAKRWAVAAIMILAALMDMIDINSVNVGLPSMARDLQASGTQLQWVVSAYLLGFAGTLIIAGHLGDRYGRKRLFLVGVAAFAVASLASGLARSPEFLIGARAVQGVAAATLMPQVLASFRTLFQGGERAKAFGVYGAVTGLAAAVGILLGGALVDWDLFGWQWRTVFFINLPIALIVLAIGSRIIPADERAAGERPDVLGALALAAGLVAIVLPLSQGRDNGWPLWGWICMAAGVLAVAGVAMSEARRRVASPLLPAAVLKIPAVVAGLGVMLLFYAAMQGLMLAFAIWLQAGQGYTPFQAGLLTFAFAVGTILVAANAGTLATKYGRIVLVVGGIAMGAGTLLLRHAATGSAPNHTGAWPMVPGLLVMGIGLGFLVIPLVNVVLSAVPAQLAGSASGIFSTAQQFGGALGIPVLGSIFFGDAAHGLTEAFTRTAPWAAAAFFAAAALCLALPRTAISPETAAELGA